MSFQLLYPALLLALAGLVLPLLIHLWNRKRGQIVLFGSTQFLKVGERKKVSRISFSQPLLFLLRASMIGLCALLLAEPVRVSISQVLPKKNPNWLLISPSLLEADDWKNAIDSIRYRDYERRVLARGFFTVNTANDNTNLDANRSDNVWSLLADAAAHPQAPDSIAVYFTPQLNDFDGTPPKLPTSITWHEIPQKNDSYHILSAWQISNDELALIIGKGQEDMTTFRQYNFAQKALMKSEELPDIIFEEATKSVYFKHQKKQAIPIQNQARLNAVIFYDNSFKRDRNYLIAALESISKYTDIQINIKKERLSKSALNIEINEATNAVFWLSKKALDKQILIPANTCLFTYKENEVYKKNVVERAFAEGEKRYTLTRRIRDGENSTQLPHRLLEILLTPDGFEHDLAEFDQRKILPDQYAIAPTTDFPKRGVKTEEKKEIVRFHNGLWWLLLGLFFVEGIVRTFLSAA